MPWASVSEKPTRVSDEYLNGGLRSVSRPSSSVTRRMLRRRLRCRPEEAVPAWPARPAYASLAMPTRRGRAGLAGAAGLRTACGRERRQRAAARAGQAAIPDPAGDAPGGETDQHQAEDTDGKQQPEPADLARARASAVAVRARREVADGEHLRLLRAERGEGRDRHERVDEPFPAADGAQVDVEDDRALLGRTLAGDQLQLEADLVARDVEDVPGVRRSTRGERVDRDVAARPLLASDPRTQLGGDDVVRGRRVGALDRVVHEDVDRARD